MSGRALRGGAPFVFGKLPSHGDFIARGLTGEAREAWDSWASAGLGLARDALGDRFEAIHDAAPCWRFALGPGRFGPEWRVGAVAPSIDRVGRRFLLSVGVDRVPEPQARASAALLAERMEELIYQALADDWTADALFEAAARALESFDQDPPGAAHEGAWTADPDAPALASGDIFSPDGLLRMLRIEEAEGPT